ncbi:MAG: hypothetical protein M1341_04535 [Candidatus Thermoplasmatota archaeon]|nr:hypothetical protein [Candidatus Thermoplasmatota archaeon]
MTQVELHPPEVGAAPEKFRGCETPEAVRIHVAATRIPCPLPDEVPEAVFRVPHGYRASLSKPVVPDKETLVRPVSRREAVVIPVIPQVLEDLRGNPDYPVLLPLLGPDVDAVLLQVVGVYPRNLPDSCAGRSGGEEYRLQQVGIFPAGNG